MKKSWNLGVKNYNNSPNLLLKAKSEGDIYKILTTVSEIGSTKTTELLTHVEFITITLLLTSPIYIKCGKAPNSYDLYELSIAFSVSIFSVKSTTRPTGLELS